MKAAKDPGLLEEADKQRLEIDPLSGDEIQKLVAALYETPQPIVDRVVSFLGKKKKRKKD